MYPSGKQQYPAILAIHYAIHYPTLIYRNEMVENWPKICHSHCHSHF